YAPVPHDGRRMIMFVAENVRRLLPGVERRWGRQLPLERRGPGPPWIGAREALGFESLIEKVDKYNRARARNERAKRRHHVPRGVSLCIVDDAPWHSLEAKEMLGEERQVDAREHGPEVPLRQTVVVHVARHLREPVVEPGEDR